ncbi:MAG: lipid-A-disaccharide synthetase [Planctomycetes bacterium]|nr:lipid-A-disaccharide synthetase [Planctomycetota bacterium]
MREAEHALERAPTIFFSAGEPSGDLHGANLIDALRERCPGVRCEGFGGERMEAAGCRLLYSLSRLSLIGLFQVAVHLPVFVRLVRQATQHFRERRSDAVVLIDYPGFNWWIARRAHALGIPVFYFVPPQIWGWATWRVRKMRRWVDHVLCTLPFERPWFESRGVAARYIGHPYFDDLRRQRLDADFLARQRARPGTVVGLLPGSRRQELENNLATQLRAAAHVHRRRPDTRFLIACFREEHADRVVRQLRERFPGGEVVGSYEEGLRGGWELPVEVCVGRTPEIIELSHSCVTVSGSVSLELLFRAKPAVVLYRVHRPMLLAYYLLKRVPFITLVNLLAGRMLFPEFVTHRCESAAIGDHVLRWLENRDAYEELCRELRELREQVAEPGACTRAAAHILQVLGWVPPLAA